LGITVPGTRESHCKHAIRNVLELINLVGREKENIKVRKALDEKESGRTFISTSPKAKKTQVCMGVKDKN